MMINMAPKYCLPILLCLLLPSISLAAEPRQYQFEIIIFQYTNLKNIESETWPDKPGLPDYENQLALISTEPRETDKLPGESEPDPIQNEPIQNGYRQLGKEELLLNKEANAVSRSSSRKLLLHAGWVQAMYPKETARPIVLRLGDEYTTLVPDPAYDILSTTMPAPDRIYSVDIKPENSGNNTDNTSPIADPDDLSVDTAAPVTDPDLFSTPMIPQIVPQLEGTLTVSIGRYLHVWTDLVFRIPLPGQDNPALIDNNPEYTLLKSLRYQSHRRMRSKELHYIDNPSFGILIYSLPYKKPDLQDIH
ncbi:MAG TPA: hypothetical protein ENI65_11290 [Gammaproteobacteria bacterium]|nr:hypothetical protein [Gammaproteobacteria bacterium]